MSIENIKKLVDFLNYHTKLYDEGHPQISDQEWDDAYFDLLTEEKIHGVRLPDSPTLRVNYQIKNELEKVQHEHLMLSLAKTKSPEEVKSFLGTRAFCAMAKMDGLSCALTYENGVLIKAETRGNGEVGEDITHNALTIPSIPTKIINDEKLVIHGEIICKYNDFEDFSDQYENPRNFAAGSIRLLDASECAKRKLTFVAWDIVQGGADNLRLNLFNLFFKGFEVVPYHFVDENQQWDFDNAVNSIRQIAKENFFPIDGLVFKFNDVAYGNSLGHTGHHFKNALAFKFYDEEYPTTLRSIEWTMGRTGALTPVAIFDPIEIDGSTVSRASLHNVSVMEELSQGFERIGDTLYIYKANQIIPQVSKWEHNGEYSEQSHLFIPIECPICGGKTEIKMENNTKGLYCVNPMCDGKLINKLDHYCGKKGLDIKGLSKATLEKLIDWGWLTCLSDLYTLSAHATEWQSKTGFGPRSVQKILDAIEESKDTTLQAFLSAIGIPLIGSNMTKELVKYISSYSEFRSKVKSNFDFTQYEGFAEIKASFILNFDYSEADWIYETYLNVSNPKEEAVGEVLSGKTIAITGKLNNFKNRAELQRLIEAYGGKVASSVSAQTSILINNDNKSQSAKNLAAQKHGVTILTEQEFIETYIDK